ncbi:MAG: antiterminator LoaP [Lachnospiraceae bacterium]|nr:antiterminator LoaP [Lachnospiraceae bacterium]
MWFVTQVMTGKEEEVRQLCLTRKVCSPADVFYFMSEQKKKVKGEMTRVLRPLFPGYLFFEISTMEDAAELKQQLRKVPAMTKLLSAGEDIVAVYPEEENLLRILGGENHVIDASTGIIEGDQVKVMQGPLRGQEALICHIDRHKRKAILQVHLFNRTIDMPVGLEIIKRI